MNGLNDDPGWRPPPPPVNIEPSQQLAVTCTWMVLYAGRGSAQPPRAKLSYWYLPARGLVKYRPPTMAVTKPVDGSTEAIAMSTGNDEPSRVAATTARASSSTAGSMVVCTRSPPAASTDSGRFFCIHAVT